MQGQGAGCAAESDIEEWWYAHCVTWLQVGPTSVAEVEALSPAAADVCIKEWRRRAQVVLQRVVPAEFSLCSLCFRDVPFLREKALLYLGQEASTALFKVSAALAEGLKTEAKLMLLLDLYEATGEALPWVEKAFAGSHLTNLRLKAKGHREEVAEAVRRGFRAFEEFVATERVDEVPRNGSYAPRGLLTYVTRILWVLSKWVSLLHCAVLCIACGSVG